MTNDFRGPSARRFEWHHIFNCHSEGGRVARQSRIKTIFTGMTEAQIKTHVKAAWRKRKRISSQIDALGIERIKYQGRDSKTDASVEFWYNEKTKIVETAYPMRHKL